MHGCAVQAVRLEARAGRLVPARRCCGSTCHRIVWASAAPAPGATQRAAASSENDATTAAADASPKEDVTDGVCLFGDGTIAVAAAAAATPGSRIAPKPALFTRTLALACPVPAFYPHTLDARLPAI